MWRLHDDQRQVVEGLRDAWQYPFLLLGFVGWQKRYAKAARTKDAISTTDESPKIF